MGFRFWGLARVTLCKEFLGTHRVDVEVGWGRG